MDMLLVDPQGGNVASWMLAVEEQTESSREGVSDGQPFIVLRVINTDFTMDALPLTSSSV